MPIPSRSCWASSPPTTPGAGRTVELTPTEFDLLRALSLNAGRVTMYEALLDQVWNDRNNGGWKVVHAFIKQLRAKLGDDAASSAWIFNAANTDREIERVAA